MLEFLQEQLYGLDAPSRTRTVPMQVLAVGPSRSATLSLRTALLQLGYDHTYHGCDIIDHGEDDIVWHKLRLKREEACRTGKPSLTAADFDMVIGHCAAITDHEAAAYAPELIAAYPEAKVILNIRKDADAWYESVVKTLLPLQKSWLFWVRSWFCAELFWTRKSFFHGNWKIFYRGSFEKNWRQVLDDHIVQVKSLVPPERLLEWDVHDGWEPLCAFLGKPVPTTPFPSKNRKREYEEKFEGYNARADRNIVRCMSALVGMGALWAMTR